MRLQSFYFPLGVAAAKSTLLSGGTIIAFDEETESLRVIRDGSILITDDRVASVNDIAKPSNLPNGTEQIDVTGQIITPGFIDTHRHLWQTAFKTLGSNTTLVEYFGRYGQFAAAPSYEPRDVYLGQLTGIYESLNGGVTTILDHAHHTWTTDAAYAGINATVESGARVFYAYTFQDQASQGRTVKDQIPDFREIAESNIFKNSPSELGVSYDSFGPPGEDTQAVVDLIKEYDVSVLTVHTLGGPWGITNFPSELHRFDVLNTSVPVVFSHASMLTPVEAQLARSTNQYISITPESEMHYGHGHPSSYFNQDFAALGVDTHFTYSADILTQARIWLQEARLHFFNEVLDRWNIPAKNPMSVYQAFMLATRAGGLALRRPDLGVIRKGAKADLVVWNAKDSVSMLGWSDPVAAVVLHANIGDVLHVTVDGKFVKKDGKLTASNYGEIKTEFLESAKKIQKIWKDTPYPLAEGAWMSGYAYGDPVIVDTQAGEGNGYGQQFLE